MLRQISSRLLLAGCLLLVAAYSAFSAQPWESTITPLAPGPFPEIKPLRVQYHFGWNGITAATADLHLTKSADGRLLLETTGTTVGLVRTLWKFDLKDVSTTEARTLKPIQLHETEMTRGKILDTVVDFTPEKVTSRREERRGSAVKSKIRTFDFPNTFSLTSALLFLRTRPLPDGTVEHIVVYPVTAPYLCTITVLGREHLVVPTGAYDAIKVDLQVSRIGKDRVLEAYKKLKHATIWLTNDSEHLVLRIEAHVFIGTVFAELQSVQFDNPKP